jgi:hypothetical protein
VGLQAQQPTYPLSIFLTAHLLSQISSQAVHKFLLHCPSDPTTPTLHIWVFHPGITISLPTRPAPFPAAKIYYRPLAADSVPALLASSSKLTSAVEEIRLPADVMRELTTTLEASTSALPPSVRSWNGWQIGFLDRWAEG